MTAEQATIQSDINETTRNIKKLEENWKDLQVEYERLEMLLEKSREKDTQDTLRETLSQQIYQQEKLRSKYGEVRISFLLKLWEKKLSFFLKEKTKLTETRELRAKQQDLWMNVCRIFEVKAKCSRDAKASGIGGTMSLTKDGAETFTLQ